jgi:hypothetical protein
MGLAITLSGEWIKIVAGWSPKRLIGMELSDRQRGWRPAGLIEGGRALGVPMNACVAGKAGGKAATAAAIEQRGQDE